MLYENRKIVIAVLKYSAAGVTAAQIKRA